MKFSLIFLGLLLCFIVSCGTDPKAQFRVVKFENGEYSVQQRYGTDILGRGEWDRAEDWCGFTCRQKTKKEACELMEELIRRVKTERRNNTITEIIKCK